MDPATLSVAHRQAEAAAEADRAAIRCDLSALWCALGFAIGVIFTLAFMERL